MASSQAVKRLMAMAFSFSLFATRLLLQGQLQIIVCIVNLTCYYYKAEFISFLTVYAGVYDIHT